MRSKPHVCARMRQPGKKDPMPASAAFAVFPKQDGARAVAHIKAFGAAWR